jgi:carotenoid cleavage dioxygenase-like enzyme
MSVIPGQPGSELIAELAGQLAPAGVMCLVGISSSPYHRAVDLNRTGASMVLANSVTFGTVSAARRHYELAVEALARAGQAWLDGLISQRVPLSAWPHMLTRQPGDVKVAADLTR